jgi:hypothetical protein
MHEQHNRTLLALALTAPLLVPGATAAADQAGLERRIAELERQLAALQAARGVVSENLEQLVVADGAGYRNTATGSTFTFKGYVKADALYSDYSDGSAATAGVGDDFMVASTIPIGGEDGDGKLDLHAKQTRMIFATSTPTDVGTVRSYVETDFLVGSQGDERISNSFAMRLRHAFMVWERQDGSEFLAGQYWSTFFNTGALPETLDFVGPVGTVFERQPQFRYTKGALQFAVENPSTGLYGEPGGAFTGDSNFDRNGLPDLVLRYNGGSGDFSYSLAGMGREIAYEQGGRSEQEYGLAVAFAGKLALGGNDLRFQLNYGTLGRYLGLQAYRDGVIEADGDIELVDVLGGYVAYRHVWGDGWRSNLVLAASQADNPASAGPGAPDAYRSAHANLLYSPTPKLTFGGELIYAEKSIEGEINGSGSGDLLRLQFSSKLAF